MEWVLYNDELGEFRFIDESFLGGLRDLSEAPSDDPDYQDEFDELEQQGWRKASALTLAMALGDVHDAESLMVWSRGEPDQAELIERLERLTARMEAASIAEVPAEALPPERAAAFMGLGLGSLEYLIRARKIRYVQVGDQRTQVIRIADLRKFMDEHTVNTAEEELRKRGRRR